MGVTPFPHGVSSFGNVINLPMDVGNVYWVNNSPTSAKGIEMTKKFGSVVYADDSYMMHTTIASAISACKGGRNDYVICGTGNYALTAALSLSGKSSVHLLGQNGLGSQDSTVGAAALTQGGNYAAVTMEAYGELAGFQIINKAGYSAVNLAEGVWRPQVHNNCFHMTQGNAISIIDFSGTFTASYGRIYRNRFATLIGGVLTAVINVGTGTGCDITDNIITCHNGTVDCGILSGGAQCLIANNMVSDSGGSGTITTAIQLHVYSSAIGNRCAVGAGAALGGGTAAHSFVDNMDGATGAGNGSASNLET